MRPTLYDILGVSSTASRDEIKTAWREAADRFEPGSGGSTAQFRLFNDAAEVLLDPLRRQEYDEELAPGAATAPSDLGGPRSQGPSRQRTGKETGQATEKPPTHEVSGDRGKTRPADARQRRGVPVRLLFLLGVLAGALLGAAIYLFFDYSKTSDYRAALDEAPQSAERAAAAILSYDYERLDADRDAAAKFLTPDYREEYVNTFDKLVNDGQAEQVKAKVTAEVLASSTMVDTEGSRDPDKVRVLLFVDQTTVKAASSGEPRTALNRARFDMVNVDGTWLVDDITSY